jgi:hypothetical protein
MEKVTATSAKVHCHISKKLANTKVSNYKRINHFFKINYELVMQKKKSSTNEIY